MCVAVQMIAYHRTQLKIIIQIEYWCAFVGNHCCQFMIFLAVHFFSLSFCISFFFELIPGELNLAHGKGFTPHKSSIQLRFAQNIIDAFSAIFTYMRFLNMFIVYTLWWGTNEIMDSSVLLF